MNELSRAICGMQLHAMWATDKILTASAELTPDELRTPIGVGGYGDLLETLVHLYNAQNSWYQHARYGNDPASPTVDDLPDIATIRTAFAALDGETLLWLESLSDIDLTQPNPHPPWWFKEGSLQIWQMLVHADLHAHQHRAEIALVLSQLGHSPGDLDLIDEIIERREMPHG